MSDAPRSPHRMRRMAARLAVPAGMVMAAVTVALLLAEASVRLLAPQQLILIRPDLWQPADTVGWLHRPNVAVRMNTGERTVTVYTDRDGFRIGKDGRREAPTEVLLLGDSFMEALQVEHEETVAYFLENELARRLGAPVVVRNGGVAGWNPNQYLLQTRALGGRNAFALIIVAVFVGNDVIGSRSDYFPPRKPVERKQFRLPREPTWNELVDAQLAPVNDFLEVRSHLFILVKNQLATLRMRLGITAEYFPLEYRREEAGSPRWHVTAEVARDLAHFAAARGIPTLFVLIPGKSQVYEDDFRRYLRGFEIDPATVDVDQPSRLLHEAFVAESLDVVNALPAFRTAAAAGPRLFGTVDGHLSAAGHRVLANLLAPAAAQLLPR